jgi:hypothetical protein
MRDAFQPGDLITAIGTCAVVSVRDVWACAASALPGRFCLSVGEVFEDGADALVFEVGSNATVPCAVDAADAKVRMRPFEVKRLTPCDGKCSSDASCVSPSGLKVFQIFRYPPPSVLIEGSLEDFIDGCISQSS